MKRQNIQKIIVFSLLVFLGSIISYSALVSNIEGHISKGIVNQTDDIEFTVTFNSPHNLELYVCRDSSCASCDSVYTSGCLCTQTTGSASSLSCSYTTKTSDSATIYPYFKLYNTSNRLEYTGSMGSHFSINRRPGAVNIKVTPEEAVQTSTLRCSYDFYDPDGNSEDTTKAEYRWYWDPDGNGPLVNHTYDSYSNTVTSSNIPFGPGSFIYCGVKTYDQHGLATDGYNTSGEAQVRQWNVVAITDVTDNSNETNKINEREEVTFDIDWNSVYSTEVDMVICSTNSTNAKQCAGRSYCSLSGQTSNQLKCNYTTTSDDLQINPYYVFLFSNESNASFSGNSFYMNHRPIVSMLDNLTTDKHISGTEYNYSDSANLYCNITSISDPDGDETNYSITWLLNRSNKQYNYSSPRTEIMTHGNTEPGDLWSCIVRANDGSADSLAVQTEWAMITSDNAGSTDYQPFITNLSVNSNITDPTIPGDQVTFTISWDDYYQENDEASIYICNSSRIEKTGCMDGIFYEAYNTTLRTFSPTYQVKETDRNNNYQIGFWVAVCNHYGGQGGDWQCSNYNTVPGQPMGYFSVNHRPIISDVSIIPQTGSEYTNETNLICRTQYSDQDSDYYKKVNITYEWYKDKGTGYSLFLKTNQTPLLAHANIENSQKWKCTATPNDGHADGTAVSSGEVVIGSSIDKTPIISFLNDSSTISSPSIPNSTINFTVRWFSLSSLNSGTVYICNSTQVTLSGCLDYEYARNSGSSSGVNLQYTVKESDYGNQDYYAYICDTSARCSNLSTGSLSFNHLPTITSVNMNTSTGEYSPDSNLKCNVEFPLTDIDGDSVVVSYRWYINRTGNYELYPYATSMYLTHGNIELNDWWTCSAIPSDGKHNGSEVFSQPRKIDQEQAEITRVPVIDSASFNAEQDNPANYDSSISFSVKVTDMDSQQLRLFMCSSPNIIESGCFDAEYARKFESKTPYEHSLNFSFSLPAGSFNHTKNPFWIMVCDENNLCSNNYNNSAYINHEPEITAQISNPDNSNDMLICSYTYDGKDTIINDSINSINYSWHYKSPGSAAYLVLANQYNSTLYNSATLISRGSGFICEAEITDNYGLIKKANSTSQTMSNTKPEGTIAITPQNATDNQNLTCNVYSYDRDSDTVSYNISWYVNNNLIQNNNHMTLYPSWFSQGNSVYCSAELKDNESSSTIISDAIIIQNHTEPVASSSCVNISNISTISESVTFCYDSYTIQDGLKITGSDMVINCNQSLISGSSNSTGITIYDSSNITLRSCRFADYRNYIIINGNSTEIIIENNTFYNTNDIMIYNNQTGNISADYNTWLTNETIGTKIYDYHDNSTLGEVILNYYYNLTGDLVNLTNQPEDNNNTPNNSQSSGGSSTVSSGGGGNSGGGIFQYSVDARDDNNGSETRETTIFSTTDLTLAGNPYSIENALTGNDSIYGSDKYGLDENKYETSEQTTENIDGLSITGMAIKDIRPYHIGNLILLGLITMILTYAFSSQNEIRYALRTNKMKNYISEMAKRGHSARTIHNNLINAGWNRKTVMKELHSYRRKNIK